ncbi:MAG: hypothetical protein ACLUOO_10420 [Coprococcus sp.]
MVEISGMIEADGTKSLKELYEISIQLKQQKIAIDDADYSETVKKILEKMSKLNAKQMDTFVNKGLDKIKSLSHLVLVVDEFTELKRFSSESNDVDFIAEITTIARVGRTLGFHIILVSQNIEGAITDDIRVNSKSRICLRLPRSKLPRK